jgi:site-specific recombinase XerD
MSGGLVPIPRWDLGRAGFGSLPDIIGRSGEAAAWRFIEFFAATIRNRDTRAAYAHAVAQFFAWCESHGVTKLEQVKPVVIAAYIETHPGAAPTVKQHLAAIKMLFDFLVTGQIVPMNPAASVRGPTHVVKKGKTSVLSAEEMRTLLDSINIDALIGLRDRALIALMGYTFARVGAAVQLRVEDYYVQNRRGWVRLHEKGGKVNELPCQP